jgi:Flp pilus assembly protein TadG
LFRKTQGQTTVEFAFAALLFFGLLFTVMDLGIMFYVNLTMQHAVREGTRYAVTGRHDGGLDRRAALVKMIKDQSMGLYDKNINPQKDPTIKVIDTSKTFNNYTSGTLQTGNPGKVDETIVVSLTYTWPLITPILKPFFKDGAYTFTARSTMKNEPMFVP